MNIDIVYFYFIKDNFFEIVNDPELMQNKENGVKRPCYFCFKSKKMIKLYGLFQSAQKLRNIKKFMIRK